MREEYKGMFIRLKWYGLKVFQILGSYNKYTVYGNEMLKVDI